MVRPTQLALFRMKDGVLAPVSTRAEQRKPKGRGPYAKRPPSPDGEPCRATYTRVFYTHLAEEGLLPPKSVGAYGEQEGHRLAVFDSVVTQAGGDRLGKYGYVSMGDGGFRRTTRRPP